jgi:hypothetical protein
MAATLRVTTLPITTSSPCVISRYSPNSSSRPLMGLRVNTTPLMELALRLPNTICCTVTAVPKLMSMDSSLRYSRTLRERLEAKTSSTHLSSCSKGSSRKAAPSFSITSLSAAAASGAGPCGWPSASSAASTLRRKRR